MGPKYNYGKAERGLSYEYENFVSPLKNLGADVFFFDAWNRQNFTSYTQLEEYLLSCIKKVEPNIVIWFQVHYEISYETIYEIRQNCCFMIWGTDDSWKFDLYGKYYIGAVDYYLTPDIKLFTLNSKKYHNLISVSWGVPKEFLSRIDLKTSSRDLDVVFIGSNYGTRDRYINYLKKNGVNVTCYGHGWCKSFESNHELRTALGRAKIALNFSGSARRDWPRIWSQHRQIKARLFEVPAARAVLLTEEVGSESFYFHTTDEILTFRTKEELLATVKELILDQSTIDRLSKNAHHVVEKKFTYENIFKPILELAAKQPIMARIQTRSPNFFRANQAYTVREVGVGAKMRAYLLLFYKCSNIPLELRKLTEKAVRFFCLLLASLNRRLVIGKKTAVHRVLTFYGDF